MLKASLLLIAALKLEEGYSQKPYRDSAGLLTCGYGHLLEKPCTKEQARKWLQEDTEEAERVVDALVRVPLNQNEHDAVVSWIYNLGWQVNGSRTLALLNSGDKQGFANALMSWNKVTDPQTKQKRTEPGLTKRRARERDMFLYGKYRET